MRSATYILSIFFLSLGSFSTFADETKDSLDAVVARVGDEVITGKDYQQDLQHRVRIEQNRQAKIIHPDRDFRLRTLRERVDALILKVLVKNADIEVTDEEVQADYNRHRRNLPTEAEYTRYLALVGLDHEGLLQELRTKLKTAKYIEGETANIEVTEEEARKRYDEWATADMTTRPEPSVTFAHIFVRSVPGKVAEDSEARTRAAEIHERIESGEAFADVAREMSDDLDSAQNGGLRRDVPISYLPPEISEALSKLDAGELAPPTEGRYGWHILRMDALHAVGEADFEELQGRINEVLLAEKKAERLQDLLKSAGTIVRIEINEDAALKVPFLSPESSTPPETP